MRVALRRSVSPRPRHNLLLLLRVKLAKHALLFHEGGLLLLLILLEHLFRLFRGAINAILLLLRVMMDSEWIQFVENVAKAGHINLLLIRT